MNQVHQKDLEDLFESLFEDFEVPASTDGSYMGTQAQVKATQEYMNKKIEEKLTDINARLKASQTKVSVKKVGNTLQLRATLPLKPGDTNKSGRSKKQYFISLGIPANLNGLKTAEEEAYELGKLIARKCFEWNDKYFGKNANHQKVKTFKQILETLENEYFSTRKRTIKSEHSFWHLYKRYTQYFDLDLSATSESIITIIKKITSPTSRDQAIRVARVFSKIHGIEVDFKDLKLPVVPNDRYIPSDVEIIEAFEKYQKKGENTKVRKDYRNSWKLHRLVFGLIATYGLRPREVFNQPDLEWFLSSDNTDCIWKVHKSNKTGYREVLPFVPEWVELFELKNPEAISLLSQKIEQIKSFQELSHLVQTNARWFRRILDLPFEPYDLRHACAIRAHIQGLPIKASADNLGHSVEMHTKVYQRWFSLENRKKVMKSAITRKSYEELETEVLQLKAENEELKLQLHRLSRI
ncbi:site-specific integrase [Mastigocoleus sp. MO_188.B34]|uniref:site-specific integrase n=1 Tax=Mastigocoleus sp. MO_188.B34 TaxID=3036635 RepID=UPI00262D8E2A|nr:site-specific integrase [Mastigocoleus sp. MO_188.B34]MDJ0697273.1 site-specific integrase [Mastigocoleus sp. MO_188.B34]